MPELDLTGVDGIDPAFSTELSESPQLDLSGIDLTTPKITPAFSLSNPPLAIKTQGGKVKSGYGIRKPPKKGASTFHQGIDIDAKLGEPISPAEEGEVVKVGKNGGKGLSISVKHFDGRITEYNHLSRINVEVGDLVKPEAIIGNAGATGIATGPHLDFRVKSGGLYVNPIDQLDSNPQVEGTKLKLKSINLDLTGVDGIDESTQSTQSRFKPAIADQPLDLTGIEGVEQQPTDLPVMDLSLATDPNNLNFNVALFKTDPLIMQPEALGSNALMLVTGQPFTTNKKYTSYNRAIITQNPWDSGEIISTKLTYKDPNEFGQANKGKRKPNVNLITDTWLKAWNPEYAELNQKFRKETGGLNIALVDSPKNLESLGNGEYKISSRPSRGVQALFEAYKSGGMQAFNATMNLVNKQQDDFINYYADAQKALDKIDTDHPWAASIRSGLESEGATTAQLGVNLNYLAKAFYVGNVHGWDSEDYINLINQNKLDQQAITNIQESEYQPTTIVGKLLKGTFAGAAALPRFVIAGEALGPGALPLMVYFGELHKGNREASLQALPMAILGGAMHGSGEFFSSSSGTSAPFRLGTKQAGQFTREDVSLFTDNLIKGGKTTLNLTPFERQLVLRGGNALALTGTSLISNPHQSGQDILTNLVVALTLPTGRAPREFRVPDYSAPKIEKTPLQLGQGRVGVSLDLSTPIDTTQLRDTNLTYLPSGESPTNKYGERTPTGFEKGFVGENTAAQINLPIDTANLHLLELKRALNDGSYKNPDDDMATDVVKQQALINAINALEKAIPEETKKFFTDNEQQIRESLRTNYEAQQAKKNLAEQRAPEGTLSPDEIKSTVDLDKQIPPEVESLRKLNTEYKDKSLKNFFKLTKTGQQVSLFGLDILAKKSFDAAYIGAWYVEDFYLRGVKPTVDQFYNKLRQDLGEVGKYLTQDQAKVLFEKGLEYFNTNQADPFFSKMKQDAAEKLPNRMTAQQALNVLKGNHSTEFEWTVGLEKFLDDKKVEKFSKKEIIDIIQKGQVRVEVSVAQDNDPEIKDLENQRQVLRKKLGNLRNYGNEEGYYGDKNYNDPNKTQKLGDYSDQLQTIQDKLDINAVSGKPKYSLKAYTGEKLELPGAVNSKEVKLISPLVGEKAQAKLSIQKFFKQETGQDIPSNFFEEIDNGRQDYIDINTKYDDFLQESGFHKNRYRSPHWNEDDVVAHYRSNDRTTTDNIPINFSEEFQSDWNHDIREAGGYRGDLTTENFREKGYDVQVDKNDYGEEHPIYIFGKKNELPNNYSDSISTQAVKSGGIRVPFSEQDAIKYFIKNRQSFGKADSFPEPNPFMSHNWKELILKRFIRDSVVEKNPEYKPNLDVKKIGEEKYVITSNGESIYPFEHNGIRHEWEVSEQSARDVLDRLIRERRIDKEYKYEGLGWTTARQQAERYGDILEGKEFGWKKNSDGTYSFTLMQPEVNGIMENLQPHELQNISLERFAELTTKEAAEEVRSQEKKNIILHPSNGDPSIRFETYAEAREALKETTGVILNAPATNTEGKFSLKEAVELRGGMGTWADYDVALVNMAKKIGKRFGVKYSEKEIQIPFDSDRATIAEGRIGRLEKIHFLEITPSMRQSLEKEGFSLYGLGGNEPLKNPETGIRNRLTTRAGFDEHRNYLAQALEDIANQKPNWSYEDIPESVVKSGQETILNADKEQLDQINKLISQRTGTVFNSGLSPDAFIDQTKLLYKGIKEFAEFSKLMLSRFGEQVKPFLEDLWIQAKGLTEKMDDWLDYTNGRNPSKEFRQGGFLFEKKDPALEEFEKSKRRFSFGINNPKLMRGIRLAQENTRFGQVYNILRTAQRARNSFETSVLNSLQIANNFAKLGGDEQVAEAIFSGNELSKVFTDPELIARGMTSDQIKAYRAIRKAVDLNIDWRKETKFYSMRERADRLNDRLIASTPGTPAHTAILSQMIDLHNQMTNIDAYYQKLKDSGYISLQRRGRFALYAEDPAFPIGSPDRKVYTHVETKSEANKWLKKQRDLGMIVNLDAMSDVKQPENLRKASANLTPGQFEDLVDNSGVNPHSPEVEALRDEVYSRFPSFGYELKREFTKGYDRNWKFVLESIAHQTEVYASSFYSRVGGNEAIKKLSDTGLYNSNHEMYQIAQKYIDDEISAPNEKLVGTEIRKAVYMMNLAFDISQLYLNAVAQPISQTYSYFSRVEHNGVRLGKGSVEKYFIKGGKLATETALGTADPDFLDIYERLKSERVIEPEFNKSLLESEAEKSVSGQLPTAKTIRHTAEHWAGTFMRAGEKTTRTHVAAEAYLIGKERFGMGGEELVDFIVRAVDATQSNPTRGEAPYYVRKYGEFGKLLYQFNAFNHMWMENLALNVKSDIKTRNIKSTVRHLAPILLMGGVRGLPLAGFATALSAAVFGIDWEDEADKLLGKNSLLESLALYGITGSPAMSQKLTPSVPILDTLRVGSGVKDTFEQNLMSSTIPALSTSGQIMQGFDDLLSGQKLRGLGEVMPRFIRGPLTAIRYNKEGVRDRAGKVMVSRNKLTPEEIFAQTFNIAPKPVVQFYEKNRTNQLLKIHQRLKRLVKKVL